MGVLGRSSTKRQLFKPILKNCLVISLKQSKQFSKD